MAKLGKSVEYRNTALLPDELLDELPDDADDFRVVQILIRDAEIAWRIPAMGMTGKMYRRRVVEGVPGYAFLIDASNISCTNLWARTLGAARDICKIAFPVFVVSPSMAAGNVAESTIPMQRLTMLPIIQTTTSQTTASAVRRISSKTTVKSIDLTSAICATVLRGDRRT